MQQWIKMDLGIEHQWLLVSQKGETKYCVYPDGKIQLLESNPTCVQAQSARESGRENERRRGSP